MRKRIIKFTISVIEYREEEKGLIPHEWGATRQGDPDSIYDAGFALQCALEDTVMNKDEIVHLLCSALAEQFAPDEANDYPELRKVINKVVFNEE
jgi:hypothetical protein